MSKGEGEEVSWVGELRLGWTWLETFTAYRSLLSACFFPFPHSPFPFSPFVPPCSPFPVLPLLFGRLRCLRTAI